MTDERPAFQMGDISRADTSEPVVANIPHETRYRFERGDNMRDLYEQMRPDQRTALAGEFLRLLTLAGDDQADRFREDFLRQSQEIGRVEDGMLSAGEVATIDDYVREKYPRDDRRDAAPSCDPVGAEDPGHRGARYAG